MSQAPHLTERDLLASIRASLARAALAIEAISETLDALTDLAALYIGRGLTQATSVDYISRARKISND